VREYGKKACDLGSKRSCAADKVLAEIDNGGTTVAEANVRYQKQCDEGIAVGCGLLGESLLRGDGIGVDREKGKALLDRACKGGFEQACKNLAEAKNQ
jgi:TPR repeat protein